MLTPRQQKLLIRMFGHWLRREVWTLSEFKDSYVHSPSYYRSAKELENMGLTIPLREDYKQGEKKYYTLTTEGIRLAKSLCALHTNSEEIQYLATLVHYEKLDMRIFENHKKTKKGGKKDASS